eukprot:s795_g6.t1
MESHVGLFIAVAFLVQLAVAVKLASDAAASKGKIKTWLMQCRSCLVGVFPKQRAQELILWNEVMRIHIQLSRRSMFFLLFAGCSLITAAQVFLLSGLDPATFWLSTPQLWTGTFGLVAVYLFTFVPVRFQSYSVHAFYLMLNFLGLIMLLPSHCPRDQLIRNSMTQFIIFRVPSILLTPRTLLVLVVGCGYLLMSLLRFTLEPIPETSGCTVDEQFLVRMEVYMLLATTFLSFMVKAMVKRKVELSVDSSNLAKQLSAASSLLKLTCDAVLELDDNLRLTDHSPELSALLLHRPGSSMKGKQLTDFMKPDDATRATQILAAGPSGHENQISAHAFHTRLVDSCSSKLCAEVFQVKYTKHDGKEYSLLGLRDFTDVQPLSGGNAVDALEPTSSRHWVSVVSSTDEESLTARPRTVYIDIDTEDMLIQAASSPVMALSGLPLADAQELSRREVLRASEQSREAKELGDKLLEASGQSSQAETLGRRIAALEADLASTEDECRATDTSNVLLKEEVQSAQMEAEVQTRRLAAQRQELQGDLQSGAQLQQRSQTAGARLQFLTASLPGLTAEQKLLATRLQDGSGLRA